QTPAPNIKTRRLMIPPVAMRGYPARLRARTQSAIPGFALALIAPMSCNDNGSPAIYHEERDHGDSRRVFRSARIARSDADADFGAAVIIRQGAGLFSAGTGTGRGAVFGVGIIYRTTGQKRRARSLPVDQRTRGLLHARALPRFQYVDASAPNQFR